MKRLLAPLSIVNQVALLMLLSGILGVAGMGISAWMSQSIQGNAHAINKAGSLRMQVTGCWRRCRWMNGTKR